MIKPLRDKVLIRQKIERDKTTSFGMVLVNEKDKAYPMGSVVDKGELVPENIQIGDVLIFEGWMGEPIDPELAGEEGLMIMDYNRFIAKYQENANKTI